jgi:predicted DNA binding CopG/RHH family protein
MSHRKTKPTTQPKVRTSHDQLAKEAAEWDKRTRTPADFTDAPEAIPNASRSTAVSIRIPNPLLELLKTFAARDNIGYQVLIKRWLDDRLRTELTHLKSKSSSSKPSTAQSTQGTAPRFPLRDRAELNGPHYERATGDV